jgi:hypothetical protein
MEPTSLDPDRATASRPAGVASMTDLARYGAELDAIRDAMAALAASRLADTSAWVHTCWIVAQAEGTLRRASSVWWIAAPPLEDLACAVQSAWTALRDLESLGRGSPRLSEGEGIDRGRRRR